MRRSSREIVDGDRFIRRAISRTAKRCAFNIASSSRSLNDKNRPESGAKLLGAIPPVSRNQRVPTGCDMRLSMGSVGDCYDNAMAESVFASLECEVLDRQCFKTREEARRALFTWIEGWYNPHRRHSSLGYLSPANFERRHSRRSVTPNVVIH